MFKGKKIVHRFLLGAAAVVAVVVIGDVAHGAANGSSESSVAPLIAAGETQTVGAVAVAARVAGLSESEAEGIVFMRGEEKFPAMSTWR